MFICTKMNGNGNDFLVIDNMDMRYDTASLAEYAVKLCRRRESVGADGILVAEPSARADFKMRLFNRDGSEGEMCGNGARCIARFAFEKCIAGGTEMVFETLGGDVEASVSGDRVEIEMAPVRIDGAVSRGSLCVLGATFDYTFITVGVPHTVIFEPQRSRTEEEYRRIGEAIRNRTDLFREGTNVNFAVYKKSDGSLDVLTYERGVEDLTLSCGTGSVASAIAAHLAGMTGTRADVRNPGGLNRVCLTFREDGFVYPLLEGGALRIAEINASEDSFR